MTKMFRHRDLVGELAPDGTVYAIVNGRRVPVGSVNGEGNVYDEDEEKIGQVDSNGMVRSGKSVIGRVQRNGTVEKNRQRYGNVEGDRCENAGAALLLLFPEPQIVRDEQRHIPDDPPNWILIAIIGVFALMALIFVIAFVIATAIIWAVMALLTAITSFVLAGTIVSHIPAEVVDSLSVETLTTKRDTKETVALDDLQRLQRQAHSTMLSLTPGLLYGLIIICVMLCTTGSNAVANGLLGVAGGIGGVFISLALIRRIMPRRLNALLLQRIGTKNANSSLSHTQTRSIDFTKLSSWAKIVIVALVVVDGGVVFWKAKSPIEKGPPSSNSSVGSRRMGEQTLPVTSSGQYSTEPSTPEIDERQEISTDSAVSPQMGNKQSDQSNQIATYTKMDRSKIDQLNRDEIRATLNELYARHGYDFQTAAIRKQFESTSWYRRAPGRTQVEAEKLFSNEEREIRRLLILRRADLDRQSVR